ncbi:C10 family peptidase [Parabacteroides gordonii]|uniref:C10 family peptidase n=1 Tax=Parabacteroides gordonii TaxID=574930 RepID=UPI003A8AE68D
MIMKNSIIYILLIIFLGSCQSEVLPHSDNDNKIVLSNEEYNSIAFEQGAKLSDNEILNLVNGFVLSADSRTETKSANNKYSISKRYYWQDSEINSFVTKSSNVDSLEICEVDINEDEQVLVVTNRDCPHVVSYTKKTKDNGLIDDIYPLVAMREIAKYSAISTFRQKKFRNDSIRLQTEAKINLHFGWDSKEFSFAKIKDKIHRIGMDTKSIPEENPYGHVYFRSNNTRTKTTWNQDVPYNSKLPQQCSYTTQYEGRYPVGCAVVCIAQVLAHLEPYLYCDGYTMDWKSLKKESTIKRSSVATLRNQVGALMKFIGTHTKAVYGCAGTSMNTGYAMTNFLPIYGVISDAEKALNVSSVYSSLSKGNIVVLRGASEEGRHAWILDEYLITQPGYDFGDYNLKIDYVRANMGWGGDESDGFYEISEQGILEFNTITGGNFISGITCFTNVRRK